jgi:formylglycine-generating enzyme required for sulfatase activity/energy-coupling factor transporter ATP-binding protein EcfA2
VRKETVRDVNANRDVVMGDQSNVNITYALKMEGYQPPSDLKQLRADYLDHLRRTYRALDFKGIPQLETFSREMLLEEVYVPLLARPEMPAGETWERRLAGRLLDGEAIPEDALAGMEKGSAAPVRVEEALAEKARVAVIGDPGSGKTTLLKYLALRLAAEPDAPLPILAPLNAYADALSRADVSLQQYLPQYFAGLAQGVANLAPLFDSAIAQGRAVILLDGLDEVQRDRAHMVAKVEAFARDVAGRGNRVAVTSRVVGYRESPLAPKEWTLYTLLDFDREAIEQFAARWCTAFETGTLGDTPEARASAEAERKGLLQAIDANPGVARLASNPLLLTILALIKRQGVSLPNRRVELYELYLKTLITAWSKARALDRRQVGPEMDYLQILMVLGPLALWLREENPTAGLVSEQALLGWLTTHFMGEDWGLTRGPAVERAHRFLKSVRRHSNLILERGKGQYGFIHLTFEEMLAAYGVVQLGQLKLDDSVAVIRQHLTDPAWRETILLAVGIWGLLHKQPRAAGQVVRAMLETACRGADVCKNVLLAGACLEDVGQLGMGRAVAGEVTEALLAAARDRSLPPATQRDAGFALGCAGWALPDLDAFVDIPAGPFLYGDEKRKVVIERPYAIAKYPVTNLQYRRFIEAGGYGQRELWSDEGWAWRTGAYDSKAPKEYHDWLSGRPPEERDEPFYWHDRRWNNPLAPVVGISWFEAEAYCNWLAREMGRPMRLPTEEEWECAARHTDGREWPWGNKFDRRRLNCAEFWSGEEDLSDISKWSKWFESDDYKAASTTTVGQFPNGDAQSGLSDVAGNVWEWTCSWYDVEQVYRAVRGGSWFNVRSVARCAYRNGDVPDDFFDNVGFRVVSPGSISGC